MTIKYKGLTLETYKHAVISSSTYWAVKEVKTGLNVTKGHGQRARRRSDAIEEAKNNIEKVGVKFCKDQVKLALARGY